MLLFTAARGEAQSASGPSRDAGSSGPVFTLQPGMLVADFVSAEVGSTSSTGFNLRFDTRFPTRNRWFTPVVGASVLLYGTSAPGGRDLNTPSLFLGNVFPAVRAGQSGGWFTVELPLLLYHTYGGGSAGDSRLYGPDLYLQLSTYVHVGRRILPEFGRNWRKLDAYVFLEQNLTPNANSVTGRTDRFNPIVLFGLFLPIGGPTP